MLRPFFLACVCLVVLTSTSCKKKESSDTPPVEVIPIGTVTTYAGSGFKGDTDGKNAVATFSGLLGITTDAAGNLYVAQSSHHKIRKISVAGDVTTFAGNGTSALGDGAGSAASFNTPQGLGIDVSGNIYVADTYNNALRKINSAGVVSTIPYIGGGLFPSPLAIAADGSGNIYVSNSAGPIMKINSSGTVSNFAGLGSAIAPASYFNVTFGMVVDGSGNLYLTDVQENRIKKISTSGILSVFAGSGLKGSADGGPAAASFNEPIGIVADGSGNIYIADKDNHKIRKISPSGEVSSFVGSGTKGSSDGLGTSASFSSPTGLVIDPSGNYLYVTDQGNNKVRKIKIK